MKKFTLVWYEYTEWHNAVEANSEEEAIEKFNEGEFYGGELHDSQVVDDSLEVWEA